MKQIISILVSLFFVIGTGFSQEKNVCTTVGNVAGTTAGVIAGAAVGTATKSTTATAVTTGVVTEATRQATTAACETVKSNAAAAEQNREGKTAQPNPSGTYPVAVWK